MRSLKVIHKALLTCLALLGGLSIIALMLHVVIDVVMRNLSNTPIPATYEIVTNYYMVALAFIPLAWVERSGGMVQVEVIDSILSPALLRASNLLVNLISTVIYAALAWFTLETAIQGYSSGTFVMAQSVRIPTWPAYFLPPLGFSLAAVTTLTRNFGND